MMGQNSSFKFGFTIYVELKTGLAHITTVFRSVTISFTAAVFKLNLINTSFIVKHCGICGVATSLLAVDRSCTYSNINNNCELKATLKSKLLSL